MQFLHVHVCVCVYVCTCVCVHNICVYVCSSYTLWAHSFMWAGINGVFQQRTARRPNNTAAIAICLVHSILQGSFFGMFPHSFVCSVEIPRFMVSLSFLIHSTNILRLWFGKFHCSFGNIQGSASFLLPLIII